MSNEYELKTIKVSEKGQVTIPSDIQKNTGIKKGDRLFIFTKNNKIMLGKIDTLMSQIADDYKDIESISEVALKKLWDNKADSIWDKYLEKIGK